MNAQFEFAEYQAQTSLTAVYPGRGTPLGLVYCGLKLAGEAGEVAENIGKAIRDDGLVDNCLVLNQATLIQQNLTVGRREKIIKELGDVMWYVSQACTELGIPMASVAQFNLAKLQDRKERGVLQGSGDDR